MWGWQLGRGACETSVGHAELEGSVDSPARNAPEAAEFVARSQVKAVGLVMATWYLPTNTCKNRCWE